MITITPGTTVKVPVYPGYTFSMTYTGSPTVALVSGIDRVYRPVTSSPFTFTAEQASILLEVIVPAASTASYTLQQVSVTSPEATYPGGSAISAWLTDLTGVKNQRDQVLKAFNDTAAAGEVLIIDRVVRIDTTGGNEIYIPNGLKVKFMGAGRIDGMWVTNPMFIALHSQFEFADMDVLYLGPGLDSTINYSASPGQDPGAAANARMTAVMQAQYGNTFSGGGSSLWYGPFPFMSAVYLSGQAVGTFRGTTKFRVSSTTTADKFIPWCIAGKGQWNPGVTNITIGSLTITPNANISQPQCYIDDLVVDGAQMGCQGEFSVFEVKRTRSFRYSDVQGADGSNLGGASLSLPPPHLFYITERTNHVNILDTIDYGTWVTNNASYTARRSTSSGSCCSLKMGAQRGGANGYISYRPDGFMDALGDQSGYGTSGYVVQNFYAEYDSTVCGSLYPSIRFPIGPYIDTTFRNGKLVDTATQTTTTVFGTSTDANNKRITVENVEVELQDFGSTGYPGPYFSGTDHSINIRFRLKAHTATQTSRGVIAYQGTAATSVQNSRHRSEVIGWRNFYSDVNGLRNRVIMDGGSGGTNSGMNVAELVDVTNGHTATQYGGVKREQWTQKAIVAATAGGAITTSVKIPANWYMVLVATGPKVALGATGGLTGYTVGWSGTPAGVGTVTGVSTSARYASSATIASTGSDRVLVITPTGGNFDGTGTIELVFTCEYVSLGE